MKKNLPIIVALTLPLFMILFVAGSVYLPGLFTKSPKYNFVYSLNIDNRYLYHDYGSTVFKNSYVITDGKLTKVPIILQGEITPEQAKIQRVVEDAPPLYIYDVASNVAKKISFELARGLSIDDGPTSPDGFYLTYSSSNNGIFDLFGSSNNHRGWVLTRGAKSVKVRSLDINDYNGYYYGYNNIKLIGWIK